jgi:uncharacterized protein YbbK (DUF523 family)
MTSSCTKAAAVIVTMTPPENNMCPNSTKGFCIPKNTLRCSNNDEKKSSTNNMKSSQTYVYAKRATIGFYLVSFVESTS